MKPHNGFTADATQAAALVVDAAQPVWMTLNQARERAFTGEIVFETDPEVLAYLDHGIVYYAERVTDASLGRRLLDAGVIDIGQLDRGTVRVGDIEHLGRLFDRDPSVDRDAVVVVAETATEELVTDLANRVSATARVTAYRHHPSGVHRWFVAPLDPTAVQRPVGAVAQLDSTVVDHLPGLPFAGAEEFTIEWDEEIDEAEPVADGVFDLSLFEPPVADRHHDLDAADDAEQFDTDVFALSLDLAEFTDEPADAVSPFDRAPNLELDQLVDVVTADEMSADEMTIEEVTAAAVTTAEVAIDDVATDEVLVDDVVADGFEFSVVWPDGTHEYAAPVEQSPIVDEPIDPVVVDAIDAPMVEVVDDEMLDDEMVEMLDDALVDVLDDEMLDDALVDVIDDAMVEVVDEPIVTETASGDLEFTMPPLVLSDEPELADGEIPDDVADAVRRAIAAIESASISSTPGAEVTTQLPQIADLDTADHVTVSAPEFAPADSMGFAPPTMATRAEVLYGQMTADGSTVEATTVEAATVENDAPRLPEQAPSGGVASVVFVDDPVEDDEPRAGGDDDRSSALRRLIGSLRRKDH